MTPGSFRARITETELFLARCELALECAKNTGEAAWKIEGLEEAVADAKEALADMKSLGV